MIGSAEIPERMRAGIGFADTDGDGSADEYLAAAKGWGVSGNYHEYAYGPAFDKDGNDIGGSVNTLTSERWTPYAFGNAQHTIMAEISPLEADG